MLLLHFKSALSFCLTSFWIKRTAILPQRKKPKQKAPTGKPKMLPFLVVVEKLGKCYFSIKMKTAVSNRNTAPNNRHVESQVTFLTNSNKKK